MPRGGLMAEWDDLRMHLNDLEHGFETDIRLLVTENHRITMRGIQQSEDEIVDYLRKELAQEDGEVVSSAVSSAQFFYDDLRRAANHMALVSLVTRLEHWTREFVKQLSLNIGRAGYPVVRDMTALNERLGTAPVDVEFFKDLVTARDSVIHGDSKAEWPFRGAPRRVAARYADCGDLDFTDEHLRDAIRRATMQVRWYDERIAALAQSSKKQPTGRGSA
jgi:hypothetical protein